MKLFVTGGAGLEPALLYSIRRHNNRHKKVLFGKANTSTTTCSKKPAPLGPFLEARPGDMREEAARNSMEARWEAGAKVQSYDPEARQEAQCIYGHGKELSLCGTRETALKGADALIHRHRMAGIPRTGFRFHQAGFERTHHL